MKYKVIYSLIFLILISCATDKYRKRLPKLNHRLMGMDYEIWKNDYRFNLKIDAFQEDRKKLILDIAKIYAFRYCMRRDMEYPHFYKHTYIPRKKGVFISAEFSFACLITSKKEKRAYIYDIANVCINKSNHHRDIKTLCKDLEFVERISNESQKHYDWRPRRFKAR